MQVFIRCINGIESCLTNFVAHCRLVSPFQSSLALPPIDSAMMSDCTSRCLEYWYIFNMYGRADHYHSICLHKPGCCVNFKQECFKSAIAVSTVCLDSLSAQSECCGRNLEVICFDNLKGGKVRALQISKEIRAHQRVGLMKPHVVVWLAERDCWTINPPIFIDRLSTCVMATAGVFFTQ